ncbi:hypothetical protein [Agrobacterium tumefaciens]|uniref:hypothetical protein n=1 Tax=Agrobacterium tumefaciens TaxID=358 RepID=UPI00157224A2|nr:hypothetical protein [Agrobacterium tumefaciens]NSX90087.1 hypothetical protein [Agrobacterium tumefaciens]
MQISKPVMDAALEAYRDGIYFTEGQVYSSVEAIVTAALSAAEPVKTPFKVASEHIPEARVSLLSRAIRQGLNDYGWKNFGTLPEVLMGYIVEAERAESAVHAEPVKTAPSVAGWKREHDALGELIRLLDEEPSIGDAEMSEALEKARCVWDHSHAPQEHVLGTYPTLWVSPVDLRAWQRSKAGEIWAWSENLEGQCLPLYAAPSVAVKAGEATARLQRALDAANPNHKTMWVYVDDLRSTLSAQVQDVGGLDADEIAAAISTAACELGDIPDPEGDDTISITVRDLEAIAHRHITVAIDRAAAPAKQDESTDGRPCSMEEFITALFSEGVDLYDTKNAIEEWLNGELDAALSYLSDATRSRLIRAKQEG